MGERKNKKVHTGFTRFRKDWIEPILIAFILAFLIRAYIIQPFKVPSSSMEDTLLIGDHFIAVKFLYGSKIPFSNKRILKIRDPKPGDVLVFKYPEDPSKDFVKRCVAVGGQVLEIKNKEIFVDGKLQQLPVCAKLIDKAILPERLGLRDNFPPTVVPQGNVFVMGDNRDNSNDSRYWGPVPYDNIKGNALLIYWSWNTDKPRYDVLHRIRWNRFCSMIK
ncbi:MAG: signal peptidase I [Candidatus Latescibacteria bacterium]|nr:signal peptidase I [Candidatus Latescibacterota bacterium]